MQDSMPYFIACYNKQDVRETFRFVRTHLKINRPMKGNERLGYCGRISAAANPNGSDSPCPGHASSCAAASRSRKCALATPFILRWVLVITLLFLILISPALAFAQIPTIVPCTGATGANPCTICHIAQLAQNTLNAGVYIAVFLSAVLFAYAGWQYITAGGESGKAESAKKIFWNVGVGLILILAAWLIVDLIMKMLVNEQALRGPWHAICP